MSNRTLIVLTALFMVGMAILFALNIKNILTGQSDQQTYLKYNQVRGIAVGYNQLLYTLNFKQQNQLIDILNRAVQVMDIPSGKRQTPDIEKIVVYQFDRQLDLTITPIAYVEEDLIFSIPEWNKKGYLMELSEGDLRTLLSQTYDH